MSGTITHRWEGTTLIITSDSGTSGCDLKGEKGDMGIRGATGAPGAVSDAEVNVDLSGYATKDYVDEQLGQASIEISADIIAELSKGKVNCDPTVSPISKNPVASDGIFNYLHYTARVARLTDIVLLDAPAPSITIFDQITSDGLPEQEYRCIDTLEPPTIYLPPLTVASHFVTTVIYKAPTTDAPTIIYTGTNNYSIKLIGEDVENGVFAPIVDTVYRLSFIFDGFNINCYISGVK